MRRNRENVSTTIKEALFKSSIIQLSHIPRVSKAGTAVFDSLLDCLVFGLRGLIREQRNQKKSGKMP